jgi:N-glycosylase/DNA lyase
MDSLVAKGLKAEGKRGQLPRWRGVKWLSPEENDQFQEFAADVARKRGIQRIHLDTFLWIEGRE